MLTWAVISLPIAFALCIGANAVSPGSAQAPFGWLNSKRDWASWYDTAENIIMMIFVGKRLLPTTYYALLTTYYLLLTTHCYLPTTYYLLRTANYLLPTTYYSLLTTYG